MKIRTNAAIAVLSTLGLLMTGAIAEPVSATVQVASIRPSISDLRDKISELKRASSQIRSGSDAIHRAGTTTSKKRLADDLILQLGKVSQTWTQCQEVAGTAIRYLHEAKKNSGWSSASKRTRDVIKRLDTLAAVYQQQLDVLLGSDKPL